MTDRAKAAVASAVDALHEVALALAGASSDAACVGAAGGGDLEILNYRLHVNGLAVSIRAGAGIDTVVKVMWGL